MFPTLPPWEGSHPIIVHFPVALLLVAPVFVLLGIMPRRGAAFALAALLLMAIGTLGAQLAVMSGEVAHEGAAVSGAGEAVLERHEELAELARTVFVGLTALYVAVLVLPRALRQALRARARLISGVVFLLAYGGGALVLANAAHEGGRLVHEFGVRAAVGPGAGAPAPSHLRGGEEGEEGGEH